MSAEAGARPLRIALTIGTLQVGGAETQVVGVARQLKAFGHDVEVVVLSRDGPLAPLLAEAGVPVHLVGWVGIKFRDDQRRLRPWRPVVDAVRLLGLVLHLRRRRIDVVHAFLFSSYAVVLPLAWLARVPVLIAARRGLAESLPRYPLLGLLTRVSTALAAAVVANAEAVAQDAHLAEGVPRSKLRVIPNAVDLPEQLGDPATSPPTGLMIANLIHYKGHLDLAEALARMQDPPRIRCVGEGPMRAALEQAVAERRLQDTMLLEGRHLGARTLYAQVQFAVLASHAEGMPNAVLEAMAAGLPVVATDVGGCRELVEHGVTGLLVPPRDPMAMAAALERVTQDEQWRLAAGRLARERAQAFSWPSCAQAHVALYRQLLSSVGSAPHALRPVP